MDIRKDKYIVCTCRIKPTSPSETAPAIIDTGKRSIFSRYVGRGLGPTFISTNTIFFPLLSFCVHQKSAPCHVLTFSIDDNNGDGESNQGRSNSHHQTGPPGRPVSLCKKLYITLIL